MEQVAQILKLLGEIPAVMLFDSSELLRNPLAVLDESSK